MFRMFGVSLVCVLCVVAVGCGGGGIDAVKVSGTITLNGEPLEGATVVFTPTVSGDNLEAVASHGTTDAAGKYSLKITATDQSGVVVGKHRVTIGKFDEAEEDDDSDELVETPSLIPDHDLTFEVTSSGSDSANFDLTGSPSADGGDEEGADYDGDE